MNITIENTSLLSAVTHFEDDEADDIQGDSL